MSDADEFLEDFGAAALDEWFGDSVTASRGGTMVSELFTATWLSLTEEIDSRFEQQTEFEARQFEFKRSDYVLGGTLSEPRQGDRIKIIENGTTKVFAIQHMAPDKPAVEPLPGGYRWRVRAREVA